MNAQERLRHAIEHGQSQLRAGVPPDRTVAILALLRIRERLPRPSAMELLPDLISGCRRADLGWNLALRLCLEASDGALAVPTSSADELDSWAVRFLEGCDRLAEADLVLAHVETSFMRLVDDGDGTFDAWIATKRAPTGWRERADIDWWAAWLAERHAPAPPARRSETLVLGNNDPGDDRHFRQLADGHLQRMAYQLGYPPDAAIGGCTMQTYRGVLGLLIAWALQDRERRETAAPQSEHSLVAALAAALCIDPAVVGRAIAGFTLDGENAAWHAAVPGVAAAPLVRIEPDRIVWSVYGLTTEPLFFLTRELRRRYAQEYHNSAHLREAVFREDLYALFGDKRFVTSSGRVALRRDGGDVRTEIDAAVFDRKTGTLGLFELKSQDPFARSTSELARQRDTVLYANRQLSGVLAWLNRHGGDALLGRFAAGTARRFRVQKVFPFVLGRYLAHFSDGPDPDARAAWGTWPQVLRLRDGEPFRGADANPIASLFTRLTTDAPLSYPLAGAVSRELAVGGTRLIVHPSYAAFQARLAVGLE